MYREQLQFNLHIPPKKVNLETNFEKPRPIVIEKLQPTQPNIKFRQPSCSNDMQLGRLSSERLEFAMQLAKRDVKKLKTMLSNPGIEISEILRSDEGARPPSQQNVELQNVEDTTQKQKVASHKSSTKTTSKMDTKPKIGKVLSLEKQEKEVSYKNGQMKFIHFNEDGKIKDSQTKNERPQGKEINEIKRLRKELQKYMRRLDSVLDQSSFSQTSKIERKGHLDEDVERERKLVRAEEQESRSARVLYMLQRKVKEIQDEVEQQDATTKHTRKSQHLTRLAAAHRSAVRALQMFVNQAPLYFGVKNGLPPMYQDLGLLIQQLSLLSAQLQVGKDLPEFDIDLLPRTKTLISNWNRDSPGKSQPKPKKGRNQRQLKFEEQTFNKGNKGLFLDQHANWMRDKARDIGICNDADKSNEPTPEREAVLKAGLDALKRARESSSFIATDIKQKPSGVSFQISKPSALSKRRPKSVLFPHQIKKQRNRPFATRPKIKPAQKNSKGSAPPMHFAQQTVASILKKQDEVKYEPKKKSQIDPNHTQSHEQSFSLHESPRQRDQKIIENASPSSKRYVPRADVSPRDIKRALDYSEGRNLHYDNRIMEKEVARQAWLDRERDREIQRLDELRSRESIHLQGLRQEYSKSQRMIEDAEEKIKQTLQPLLEKAEFISHQDTLRENQYKQSVRRRLGEIVTETAMSKGEVLAEMILDDILMDTVNELQRIEEQDIAVGNAVFETKKPTIETVQMKLEEFEKEEEKIRRRWKTLHYSELETANQSATIAKGVTDSESARPIVFTAVSERHSDLQGYEIKDEQRPVQVKFQPRHHEAVPVFVPADLRASIMAYKGKYDNYLKQTLTEKHGNFDPWKLIDRISEDILEEIVVEVGKELDDICNDYVENIYADEFVRNDSLVSETSNETLSKAIDKSLNGQHH